MPRDTQIFLGAAHDGNSDYLLPKSSEIVVEAVTATFTDNGAGADWCPAVVMISDSGHTIARAMLPEVKVTAGDSAEASFFPGVKPSGGGVTPSGTALAFAQGYSEFNTGDPVQAVANGAAANGTHAHVEATDGSVFVWSTSVTTNDTLNFGAAGTYLVWANSLWDVSDVNLTSTIFNSGVTGFRHDPFLPTAFAGFVPSDGLANSQDYDVFHVTVGASSTHVVHQNGAGFNSAVNAQFLTAVYLGTG